MRVVVVGAGLAGLQTALEVRRLARRTRVILLAKGLLSESNTRYAQGGIAAVLGGPAEDGHGARAGCDAGSEGPPDHGSHGQDAGKDDSVEAHIADTLAAGAGLADPDAVGVLCRGAAEAIGLLEQAGVVFDRSADGSGAPARGREAAHSAARILHLRGDATGEGLAAALTDAVRQDSGITVIEHALVTRVLLADSASAPSRAVGVGIRGRDGAPREVRADAVVLATGGAGQLFEHTTNPAIASGDGVALAWRAGAAVADLEFFQFHPTSLDVPGNPLISEAVRGEGARLLDADGHRFMADYHPEGDLAPRDVVSRSIARHLALRATGDPDRGRRDRIHLDATHLGADILTRRFPSLTALTAAHGWDWSDVVVPVVPAAHYWMGGVRTDLAGRTTVPGLFAVGEVARTGVHGANRLASNSLLEAVVFASRCAAALAAGGGTAPVFDVEHLFLEAPAGGTQSFTRRDLQALMSDHAGILRTGDGLDVAWKQLAAYRPPEDDETANLLLCARLLVRAAIDRGDSCGAHHRSDQPERPRSHPAPTRSYARTPGGTP
ncbi:FAD-binding protein [Vibrio cholerae]|nr:FAD-binding protein [Vibrio cholerae]